MYIKVEENKRFRIRAIFNNVKKSKQQRHFIILHSYNVRISAKKNFYIKNVSDQHQDKLNQHGTVLFWKYLRLTSVMPMIKWPHFHKHQSILH